MKSGPVPNALRRLNQPQRAGAVWLGRHCVLAAWIGLVLAVVSPPHGLGLSLCWVQDTTGLPCPGCGLTRSLSCGIRGMIPESWNYHPFGLFILALFAFTALQSLLPTQFRDRLARFIQAKAAAFMLLYLAFVFSFVCFGAVRALQHYQAGEHAAHFGWCSRSHTGQ